MTVRAEQLPLAVRKRYGLETTSKPKRSRAGTAMGAPCPGRCACGQPFDRYTDFEKHSRPGHRRWTIDLSSTTPAASDTI